jgi:4'-phosphopantetheinyl transferase
VNISWLSQSKEDIPSSLDWLHPSENKIQSGFKFPKKRNDWLLGRWTAKNIILQSQKWNESDLDFNQLEIRSAPDGAPEVFYNNEPFPVFISISHSNGKALCTLTDPGTRLGCDIEKVETRSGRFVNDYFTAKEQQLIESMDQELVALWINLIWSAKESALKALRKGLKLDTRSVEVYFSSPSEVSLWNELEVTFLNDDSTFKGFWQFNEGFVLTILGDDDSIRLNELNQTWGSV